jgi:hypothetical protein
VTFEVTVTLGVKAPIPDEHDMQGVLRRMVPEIVGAYGITVAGRSAAERAAVAARANRRACPDSHSDGPRSSIVVTMATALATARTIIEAPLGRHSSPLGRHSSIAARRSVLCASLRDGLGVPMKAVSKGRAAARALRGVPALMSSVAGLHAELAGLRADLAGMPADSRRLADDVEVVHGDLIAMKADLAETAGQVDGLRTDLSGLPFVSRSY